MDILTVGVATTPQNTLKKSQAPKTWATYSVWTKDYCNFTNSEHTKPKTVYKCNYDIWSVFKDMPHAGFYIQELLTLFLPKLDDCPAVVRNPLVPWGFTDDPEGEHQCNQRAAERVQQR